MTQKLIECLREEIKTLLASKDESIRCLVRQVGVDYSVVYRITSGEQKGITFYQAYKLLRFLKPTTFLSVLGEFFPNETRDFFPNGAAVDEIKQEKDQKILADIFHDPLLYEVTLAVSCGKKSLQSIESEFGNRGLGAIEALQDIGALKVVENAGIEMLIDGFVLTDEKLIKQQIERNLQLVDLKIPGTTLFSNSAGLNQNGLLASYKRTQAYWQDMTEVFTNEENKGDIPVVMSSFLGPIIVKERK